jgi:hypothetical protein|tara:strand:+ start:516 stop:701 length:186 start_codon:yes stop_codon:yes gene_type:complete
MATAQQILASKPKREKFKTQEEFEEATNYWMSRQGRSPVLREYYLEQQEKSRSQDSQPPSK